MLPSKCKARLVFTGYDTDGALHVIFSVEIHDAATDPPTSLWNAHQRLLSWRKLVPRTVTRVPPSMEPNTG